MIGFHWHWFSKLSGYHNPLVKLVSKAGNLVGLRGSVGCAFPKKLILMQESCSENTMCMNMAGAQEQPIYQQIYFLVSCVILAKPVYIQS